MSLPPDLEALHRELEALDIEERPSFGPELKAELQGTLHDIVQRPVVRPGRQRWAMAASVVGLLALGGVPGVRASLVRAFDSAMVATRVFDTPSVAETPVPPRVSVTADLSEAVAPRVFVPIEETEHVAETQASWANEPLDALAPEYAYPVLLDPADAERIVQMFYPRRLQDAGVGGEVRVMVWVDETGIATDREILAHAQEDALNRAALSALGRLRFRPARRGGAPVGSWVKFTIKFEPPRQTGALNGRTIRESESMVVDASTSDSAGMELPN